MSNPPAFPTNLDNTDEVLKYAQTIGITFGGFVLAGFILSLVMMISCCCFNKKPKNSASFSKWIHLAITCFILAIAVIACGVGWGYNATSDKGVKEMTGSVSSLLGGSVGVVAGLQGALKDLDGNLSITIDNIVTKLQAVDPNYYTAPIGTIIVDIDAMYGNTQNLTDTIGNITAKTDDLRSEISTLNNYGVEPPKNDSVPQVDPSIKQQVADSSTSLADMRSTTVDAQSRITDSLTTITDNLIVALTDNQRAYSDQISQASNSFTDIKSSINKIYDQFQSYETQINYYSTQRTMAVNGVMILPMVIGILGVLAVFFKLIILLKITAVLSFIFFFWYVLVAGVNYTLFVVTSGFCQSQDAIVRSILTSANTTYQANGTTYGVADSIQNLLVCSGKTTFIQVLHSQYVVDDLQSLIQAKVNEIQVSANNVSFDNDFSSVTNSLSDFRAKSTNLNITDPSSLNTIENQVTVLKDNSDSGKPGNETIITTQLNIINQAYINCPSTCPLITSNANFDTYDRTCLNSCSGQQNTADQAYADGFPSWVNNYRISPALNQSQTDVRGVQFDLYTADQIQAQIQGHSADISTNLDLTKTNAKKFVTDTTGLVVGIATVVDHGIDDLSGATQCAFVSESYNSFTDGFCHKFSSSSQVIAAMMLLGATTLFATVIHSCFTIHRIRASGEDGEGESKEKSVSLEAR